MLPGKGGDAWFSLEDDIVFPLSLFARLWLVPRGSSDRFDMLQPLSIPDVAPELDLFLPCATLTDISFSLSDEEEWKMSFGSWILEAPIECMFYYNFDINSSTFKLICSYTLTKTFFLPELDVAFVDLDDSMRRCWWVRRYWIGVWFVIAARAAISRLNNGIFAFRKGKTNGRSGKFVTSCNTWWKSFTETVPAYFEI